MRTGFNMRALSLAAALLMSAGVAQAQSVTPWLSATGFDQPSYLAPASQSRNNPLIRRSPDYSSIAVSDWLFNPTLLMGALYNDNLLQTQSGRTGAAGARAQAGVIGVRDTGLSRTTLSGGFDAYIYPDRLKDNAYDARVGVAQIWELQPTLTVKAQVEFDQSTYPAFGGPVQTPGGAVVSLEAPQKYRQLQSSAAVQKSFGRYFLGASIGATATLYDALATSAGSISQDYRNSVVTTLTQRAGYWISPMLYAYGETSENWRQYVDDPLASKGYRVVAGLGSDRIGLFRGEVYGGFQQQFYPTAALGAVRSPVLGGKLFWYPTRALTLWGAVDETFSDTSNPTPSNPLGAPARVTASQIKVEYQWGRLWSAQGFAEFDASRFLGVPRIDDTWIAGVAINREMARNLNLKVDYKWLRNLSNAPGASFVNNIVGATGLYKF